VEFRTPLESQNPRFEPWHENLELHVLIYLSTYFLDFKLLEFDSLSHLSYYIYANSVSAALILETKGVLGW
jgi:hypothetical protein